MTYRLRPLLAAALLAAAGAHAVPAWASKTCNFYHYNQYRQRWERVALLVDDDWWTSQPGNARGESWECEYCAPPGIVSWGSGGPVTEAVEPLVAQAGELAPPVHSPAGDPAGLVTADVSGMLHDGSTAVGLNLFGEPPQCPLYPPEDDALYMTMYLVTD
jgi:hypothetical protein